MTHYGPTPVTPLDFRCEALLERLGHVFEAETFDLGAYGEADPRGYVETVLHEISHVVVLRRGIRAALRNPLRTSVGRAVPNFPEVDDIDDLGTDRRARPLSDEEAARAVRIANEHEIDTIAVEVIASQKLGLPFDPMDIAVFAVDGDNVRDMNAEECCVHIEYAMKGRNVRRWGRDLGRYLLGPT